MGHEAPMLVYATVVVLQTSINMIVRTCMALPIGSRADMYTCDSVMLWYFVEAFMNTYGPMTSRRQASVCSYSTVVWKRMWSPVILLRARVVSIGTFMYEVFFDITTVAFAALSRCSCWNAFWWLRLFLFLVKCDETCHGKVLLCFLLCFVCFFYYWSLPGIYTKYSPVVRLHSNAMPQWKFLSLTWVTAVLYSPFFLSFAACAARCKCYLIV